jgi:hypothetical protein
MSRNADLWRGSLNGNTPRRKSRAGLACRGDRPVAPTKSDQTAMEPMRNFRPCVLGACQKIA